MERSMIDTNRWLIPAVLAGLLIAPPAGRADDLASWLRPPLFSGPEAFWLVPEEPPRLELSSRLSLRPRLLCCDPEPRLLERRRSLS